MRELRKGTIIGLFRHPGSGLGFLAMEDSHNGKTLIPCEGNATARALDAAFPGTIDGGPIVNNEAIEGEEIYYRLDAFGTLASFCPAGETSPDLIEEFDRDAKDRPRRPGDKGFVSVGAGRPNFPQMKSTTH